MVPSKMRLMRAVAIGARHRIVLVEAVAAENLHRFVHQKSSVSLPTTLLIELSIAYSSSTCMERCSVLSAPADDAEAAAVRSSPADRKIIDSSA